jgi:hypothetical protein
MHILKARTQSADERTWMLRAVREELYQSLILCCDIGSKDPLEVCVISPGAVRMH